MMRNLISLGSLNSMELEKFCSFVGITEEDLYFCYSIVADSSEYFVEARRLFGNGPAVRENLTDVGRAAKQWFVEHRYQPPYAA